MLSGDLIDVLTTGGTLLVKQGPLDAQWILEHASASQGVLSGNLIGVVVGGTFWAKQGGTDTQWVNEYAGVAAGVLWSSR
jgi:hypothetical protein